MKSMLLFVISGISLLFFMGYMMLNYSQNNKTSLKQLRECAAISVDFEKNGNLELREVLRVSLRDNIFTYKEYEYFMYRKNEIETKKVIEYINDGTYKFMDKDGIGRTFPDGYITK